MDIRGSLQLPQLGIIKAHGADAAQFLNSQFSADIIKFDASKAQLAAYCSPQGRVLASLIVLQNAPEEFWLICSEDILEVTLKRLKMFVLRSKVELSIAADLEIQGRTTPIQTGQTVEAWNVKKEHDHVFIEFLPVHNIQRQLIINYKNAQPKSASHLSLENWEWLNIQSGLLMTNASTRDQFVPQMLNYESLGAINFNKGCYPGQEVVARSQFRGSVKRRLAILHSEFPIKIGDDLFIENEEVGIILSAARHPEKGWNGLAVLPANAQEYSLSVGEEKYRITIVPLPYVLRNDF